MSVAERHTRPPSASHLSQWAWTRIALKTQRPRARTTQCLQTPLCGINAVFAKHRLDDELEHRDAVRDELTHRGVALGQAFTGQSFVSVAPDGMDPCDLRLAKSKPKSTLDL